MRTVEDTFRMLTDHKHIMEDLRTGLRELDPDYPLEEAAYTEATQKLLERIPESQYQDAQEFLELQEQTIAANLLFLLLEGLHLNLNCFYHPVSKLFLQVEYEDIHKEVIMQTMPIPQCYCEKADTIFRNLPHELHEYFEAISSYYHYLQTVAYKLAHLYGFLLGDLLLPYMVPNYKADVTLSASYCSELENFLAFDIGRMIA